MSSFRLLLAALTVSSLGNGVRWIAIPLLAAQLSADPVSVSVVVAAQQAPFLVFGLIAGVLADRYDRKTLFWQAGVGRGLVMCGFTLVVLLGEPQIWMLAAVAFVLTCGDTIGTAAHAAMVPMLVPAEQRPKANSQIQAGNLIADPLVGALVGAVLFGVSIALPFGIDTVAFFAAAVCVALIPGTFRPETSDARPRSTVRADLAAGFQFLWHSRPLRKLCGLLALAQAIEAGAGAVLVLYVGKVLRLPAVGYGAIIFVFGVGGVIGALLSPRLARAVGERGALLLGIAACVVSSLTMGLAHSPIAAFAAAATYGAAMSVWNLLTIAVRQELVPDALMGRVVSTFRLLVFSVTPLAAIGSGLLADAHGLRAPFVAGSIGYVIALGLAARRPPQRPEPPDPSGTRLRTESPVA
ncbi:MAG TPA: MFS transporter [Candidatus Limnocylindrales bacterium]|nr:MFS transporter [Candidatus Limnocylindrales bacterium]